MTVEYVQGSKDITETERYSIENSIGTIASTPYGAAPFIRSMGIKHPPSSKSEEVSGYLLVKKTIAACFQQKAQYIVISPLRYTTFSIRVCTRS